MFMLRKLYPPISLCWWANIAFGKIYMSVYLLEVKLYRLNFLLVTISKKKEVFEVSLVFLGYLFLP